MRTNIELATAADVSWLAGNERHIPRATVEAKVARGEILIARIPGGIEGRSTGATAGGTAGETGSEAGDELAGELAGEIVGWLRWNHFWDEIPFMNMLHVAARLRGRSIGTSLVLAWENRMRELGCARVLTSTLSDETAQHFYRKLGYVDSGALLLPGEALEIIFSKSLAR